MKKCVLLATLCAASPLMNLHAQHGNKDSILQIVFTSDVHYGFYRSAFDGADSVQSYIVNAAMVAKINTLPTLTLPDDGGVAANKNVAYIDYLAITGDIANRQQIPLQSATTSWNQFLHDYTKSLNTKNHNGSKTTLWLTPGNHDASNAIGYYKPMKPLTDATSMVGIYNLMMHPAKPKTVWNFNYAKDKVNYSKDVAGVHFMFVQLWPDSVNRVWMEQDLKRVSRTTPVIIFTHVPPDGEAKHFTNPYGTHSINANDRFENLLPEQLKDTTLKHNKSQDIEEQRAFVAFLKKHPNIKAYFHGHQNFNEFYKYKGPDDDISLPVFRVDSPMKGEYSAKDEKQLSFQLISINTSNQTMTVRECLWNTHTQKTYKKPEWGKSRTISLK